MPKVDNTGHFQVRLPEGGGAAEVPVVVELWNAQGVFLPTINRERDFFIDNLLVGIDLIIEMILADRPCTMGYSSPPPTPSANLSHRMYCLNGFRESTPSQNRQRNVHYH
jgi:hypothetical protein